MLGAWGVAGGSAGASWCTSSWLVVVAAGAGSSLVEAELFLLGSALGRFAPSFLSRSCKDRRKFRSSSVRNGDAARSSAARRFRFTSSVLRWLLHGITIFHSVSLAEFRSSWSASASRRTRLASRMVLSSERTRLNFDPSNYELCTPGLQKPSAMCKAFSVSALRQVPAAWPCSSFFGAAAKMHFNV